MSDNCACATVRTGDFIVQDNGIVRDNAGEFLFRLEDVFPLRARVAELESHLAVAPVRIQALLDRVAELEGLLREALPLVDRAVDALDDMQCDLRRNDDPRHADILQQFNEKNQVRSEIEAALRGKEAQGE